MTSDMMTVEECAEYLRVNRKTVYDAIKDGELPGARSVRGTIRIHKPTMVAWFETGASPVKKPRPSR